VSPRLRRTAALSAAAVLVLSGCAGDADAELRAAVADLTASANGRDADAVRTDAQTVLDRLDAAQRSGDVDTAQDTVIRERTLAVQAAADSIDAELIARLEAEQAQQEQERLDAEGEAAEAAAEAERQRLEQERLDAEAEAEAEAREEAEEEARKAAERAAKEAEKQAEEDDEEEEPRGTGAPQPPSPSPTATS
jgi:colicin import membrane protein